MKLAGGVRAPDHRRRRATQGRMHRERAVLRLGPLTRLHIGVAVPQFPADFVGKILVNGGNTRFPHRAAIPIAEQKPALPEILVVRVNAATDVTVRVAPCARLDIDALSDKTERRASLESFDQSELRFLVVNRVASQFTQSAKLQKQRACFCRIRHWVACLTSAKIDVNIREPCW